MSPTIWWGDDISEGQLGISYFDTVGAVGSSCPPPSLYQNVITFPALDSSMIFGKITLEGLTTLGFKVTFRTFNRDGIIFFHNVDTMNTQFISVIVFLFATAVIHLIIHCLTTAESQQEHGIFGLGNAIVRGLACWVLNREH